MAITKLHCLFLLKKPIKVSCSNHEKFQSFSLEVPLLTSFILSFGYSETLQNTTQEMTIDEDFKLLKIQVFLSPFNCYFFPCVIHRCILRVNTTQVFLSPQDMYSQSELTLWWLQEQSKEKPSENWRWFFWTKT